MNYADIKRVDVANGPGVRVSLFVSGCTHHCKNCFNEVAWDFNYGEPFTEQTIETILEYLEPDYIKGITVLGGEPLEAGNQKGLLPLLRQIRQNYPKKSIWCFTGYLFDQDVLGRMWNRIPETKELFSYIDVLVDGPFIEAKKNMGLRFKGSSNQRTIMIQESLKRNEIVLWDENQDI